MKRKLFWGAAFYLAGVGLAQAADLPPVEDSDWTGLYATLSAGYSSVELDGRDDATTFIGPTDFSGTFTDKDRSRGIIGGIGAGLNLDVGDFVFGIEGDYNLLSNENE